MNVTRRALAERPARWAKNWAAFVLQLKGYAILGRCPQEDPMLVGHCSRDNVISFRARRK